MSIESIGLGEVRAKVVSWRWKNQRLVFGMTQSDAGIRWPNESINTTSNVYVDHTDAEKWFAFWVADCMDPPIYVIRAESWEDAYDVFVHEFASAIGILSEEDIARDYPAVTDQNCLTYTSSRLTHTSSGMVDTEPVKGDEITLITIDCD